jgi:tetratricopeptide (TPR) repeat protein
MKGRITSNRWMIRAVPVMALLVLISAGVILLMMALSPAAAPQPGDDRAAHPVETLYRVEAQAARDGWTPLLHHWAGDLRRELGDLPGALAHWEAAGSDDPVRTLQLAQAYLELQRWPAAIDALERLIAFDADDRWANFQLGTLLAASDPRRAEVHLRAAAHSPRYEAAAIDLLASLHSESAADVPPGLRAGLALARGRLWPQAELAFRYVASVESSDPVALAYTGWAREQQGKEGGSWLERAVAMGPEQPQVYYLYGLYLRRWGEYEASLEALRRAILLDPDNPAYYAELGSAYRLLFDHEQAEHWLRVAVAASGNDPQFQQMLAVFYAEEGYRLTGAGPEALQEVSSSLPADPELRSGFGWALHVMGSTEAALREIDAALALDPDHPQALYYKARILVETGNAEAALPLLRRAAAAADSPHAPTAALLLQTLTAADGDGDDGNEE